MARRRRPEDWEKDLTSARAAEAAVAAILSRDPRLEGFSDHTRAYDRLDFSFSYEGSRVQLDLKEKIRRTSRGLAALWPEVNPDDLFVLDETVYRRIVWQGGGGYLLVHDHPQDRWLVFGPWELTLGPRVRYKRWGERGAGAFAKGKVLLDLATAPRSSPEISVTDLLEVIVLSRKLLDAVGAVEFPGYVLDEIGASDRGTAPNTAISRMNG